MPQEGISIIFRLKYKSMDIKSFDNDLNYNKDKVCTSLILETPFTKEIRILLKNGQVMKEHKAPFPIIVHLLSGKINFGVQGEIVQLKTGAILTLEANIPHDLTALKDSTIRLTLLKPDELKRVVNATEV